MSLQYVGEIRLFAGTYVPYSWLACDGHQYNIAQYPTLYSLLGTTWGGDGKVTFNVPDLRGRVPIGQGTGTGLTTRIIGQFGGAEMVTLTDLPAHTHGFVATTANATQKTPSNISKFAAVTTSGNQTNLYLSPSAVAPVEVAMNSNITSSTGGSAAHDNMMPSLAIGYIIATEGEYPQRS